jgi:hypothetical protein
VNTAIDPIPVCPTVMSVILPPMIEMQWIAKPLQRRLYPRSRIPIRGRESRDVLPWRRCLSQACCRPDERLTPLGGVRSDPSAILDCACDCSHPRSSSLYTGSSNDQNRCSVPTGGCRFWRM